MRDWRDGVVGLEGAGPFSLVAGVEQTAVREGCCGCEGVVGPADTDGLEGGVDVFGGVGCREDDVE